MMAIICDISSTRRSASSPDETLRRELKIRRAAGVSFGDETLCRMLVITFQTKWGEIKGANFSSFPSDFQTLIKHNFLCIFFMNYWLVWEGCFRFASVHLVGLQACILWWGSLVVMGPTRDWKGLLGSIGAPLSVKKPPWVYRDLVWVKCAFPPSFSHLFLYPPSPPLPPVPFPIDHSRKYHNIP